MKEEKGITLIALIITIIVMMILAGIALAINVGEDGVINQVEVAEEKQTYAAIKENIYTQSEYTIEGKVDLNKTKSNIETLELQDIESLVISDDKTKLTITFKDSEKMEPIEIIGIVKENKVPEEKLGIWAIRGITNVVLDKLYVSEDGKDKLKLNSDGSVWQHLVDSGDIDYELSSGELDVLVQDGHLTIVENHFYSPAQDFIFEGNKIKYTSNGVTKDLILQ